MMPHFAASQLRLLRAVECSNNLRGVYFKSHPSEIGQQQSNCCDYALPALSVSNRCGNLGQDQWRTEMLTASVLTQIQINNNNNRNNSHMKQTSHIEPQQQQQQRAESAMLSTSTANGISLPEMPVAADHKFPLTSELRGKYSNRDNQSAAQQQQQAQNKYATIPLLINGKFPLLQPKCAQNFPLSQEQPAATTPAVLQARARFPSSNIMNQLLPEQRFPVLWRRPKRNFNYTIQSVHSTASPSRPPQIYKTFPTIKKQFVSFFNNQAGGCKRIPHGVEASELPTDVQATTVTQTSHKMVTEIDMETTKNNVAVAVAVAVAATVVDVDDVRTAPFDNELNAHVQTLNLNVVEETEGVGERKEIEHQQAENFNDAFGRNKDATGEGDNGDGDGDAMNAAASVGFFAKNKRGICEQSRLEIRAHNELNMTKERQSICLASEQSQRQTTIDEADAAAAGAAIRAAASNRHSDARESSSEQVDGQQRQQIDTAVSTNVTQTESQQSQSTSSLLLSSRQTSVESSRCAVRELLDETSASCVAEADLDLFDLLGDLLVQLITKSTRTGNFWSEQQQQQQEEEQHPLPGECVDMTVSKVSEDSEATVAVAVEIEEQPIELDESNSSISTPSLDMKYEVMRSSSSRLPLADSLPSRAAISATPSTIAPAPTSRIRDAALPISATPTARPLLGELKRNSSSRDDVSIDVDSLLPERTRLRRQRRMRSQESVEEKPEDVIERLNKLKARISASLSEVKGVLKQYSTESEAEAAGEKWLGPPTTSAPAPAPASSESEAKATEPVQFRFVRKVRRRSYFDEADEDKEQLKEEGSAKEQAASKDYAKSEEKETKESKAEDKLEQQEKTIKAEEKLAAKNDEEQKAAKIEQKVSKTKENEAKPQPKPAEKDKVQAKIEFLAKVQSELKSTKKKEDKPKETLAGSEQSQQQAASQNESQQKEPPATRTAQSNNKQQQPIEAVEAATAAAAAAAALPTDAAAQPAAAAASGEVTIVSTVPPHQPKKKIIIKSKNPRRASIAAVEPSKIVPETMQLDVLTQRRPSDSETIVKRKKKLKLTSVATPTTSTTSGSKRSTAATSAAEKATSATTATATANEQLVAAEVNSKASAAKNVDEDDNDKKKQTAAATAATATATPTAAATAAATAAPATAAIEQVAEQKAPLELAIDGVANRAAASEQNRRASLKLAELVGETVLVPAAAATATATTATATVGAAAATTASPVPSDESKEPINQSAGAAAEPALPQVVVAVAAVAANADIEVAPVVVDDASAPQIAATLSQAPHDESSSHQQQEKQQQQPQRDHQQDQQQDQQQEQQKEQQAVEATKDNAQEQPQSSLATMPELKVLTGPVQPVKIETVEQHVEAHDDSETGVVSKKKTPHLKKLVRKSSIDKGKEKIGEQSSKLSNILKDKNKISDIADRMNKQTPPKKQTSKQAKEQVQQENVEVAPTVDEPAESQPEPEPEPAPAPKPKKPRQIKKKVIIKRQKRRLSIGDTFFIQQEPEEPKVPEIETIEKAIAYVTDDEDEDLEPLPEPEPAKPLKSCLHVREYKIGDLILYAERYRKTQVRWKRGRILERITSISYKLEIEGKEVPAHISYIKKYTGRKVKFVGKEYLDIDYEQVVEEERRARSYSIWNMV